MDPAVAAYQNGKLAVPGGVRALWLFVMVLAYSRAMWAEFVIDLTVHSLTRSHQEMLKSKSMGGTANTCAVYCIEHLGGYLVLSAGKYVYRLDRSDLVHGFEGRRVVVTGVLDSKLNQIHVLFAQLGAQATHVYVDRAGAAVVLVAPHP